MFSREVIDYIESKHSYCRNLHNINKQYDRIPELKFVGYSKGYGTIHIPEIYIQCINKY